MDTTFIVDSSLCDSDSDWNRLLYFIQALVTHFNVSPSGGRIALIPFSTGAKAALKFNTLTGSLLNGEEVNKRVGKLECQGGSRRIDKALDLAGNEVLIPTAGMRDVSRVSDLLIDHCFKGHFSSVGTGLPDLMGPLNEFHCLPNLVSQISLTHRFCLGQKRSSQSICYEMTFFGNSTFA